MRLELFCRPMRTTILEILSRPEDRLARSYAPDPSSLRVDQRAGAGARRFPAWQGIALALVATLAPPMAAPASAFDFFGLFGSGDTPPAVGPDALSYALEIDVTGQDPADKTDLKQALRDASSLYRLRQDRAPDGEALFRRAQIDLDPMQDA
ncbi:MAG: surface antigen, partial [Hyphomicrobiales bacterium]|nr:surface antigen [Hyphomicrobiales bacterium]